MRHEFIPVTTCFVLYSKEYIRITERPQVRVLLYTGAKSGEMPPFSSSWKEWIRKVLKLSIRCDILVPDFHVVDVKEIQAWVLRELEENTMFGVTIDENVSYSNRLHIIGNLARRPDRQEWVEIIEWLKIKIQ